MKVRKAIITRQRLYSMPGISIGYYRCLNAQSSFEQLSTVPSDQLVFPDYPVSVRREDQRSRLASPAAVGWYRKGEVYQRERIGPYDDAHTWISIQDPGRLESRIFDDEYTRIQQLALARSCYVFGRIDTSLYAKVRILRNLLHTAEVADELEVEDRLAEILSETLAMFHIEADGTVRDRDFSEGSLSAAVQCLILNRLQDKITLCDLSESLGMSKFKISRLFKAETGETVYTYRNRVRLALAVEFLLGTDLCAAEIAFRLGFSSPSHFGYVFRQQYGCPPAHARNASFRWLFHRTGRRVKRH